MANSFYMDASALAKRYVPEKGTAQVDTIFDTVPANKIYVLSIGPGEVLSILVRKRNGGLISAAEFLRGTASFEAELVRTRDITKVSVTRPLVTGSLSLILAHSINSTDALVLKSALALAKKLRKAGDNLVLVASDQRLLRAAQGEGMATFDPESQDNATLTALIAS